MNGERDTTAADHLREALKHLQDAREGDLRKTHAVAVEEAARTVARVLDEHERDR
jgi:hypothetical protein